MRNLLVLIILFIVACTPSVHTDTDESNLIPCYGISIGASACDFTLNNASGDEVSLYDYLGSPILLDFSAMWCAPCQAAAQEAPATQDTYDEYGLVYLTVLIEDLNGNPPTAGDLLLWEDAYGSPEDILSGSGDLLNDWPLSGWPTFYYINEDMVLEYYHGGWSTEVLDNNIRVLLEI